MPTQNAQAIRMFFKNTFILSSNVIFRIFFFILDPLLVQYLLRLPTPVTKYRLPTIRDRSTALSA